MTLSTAQIHYLAGWLEGEGCFDSHHNAAGRMYPRIVACSKDKDSLEKVQAIMGGRIYQRPSPKKPEHAQQWYIQLSKSRQAVGWMMTLYPLLSKRRQAKIEQLLSAWKEQS